MSRIDAQSTAAEVRAACRAGTFTTPTSGLALGFVQANLVVLPKEYAFDFLLFCQRNPKPCPLLDVTEPGSPEPRLIARDADVRTDVPRYPVYQFGELTDEPTDLLKYWRDHPLPLPIASPFHSHTPFLLPAL